MCGAAACSSASMKSSSILEAPCHLQARLPYARIIGEKGGYPSPMCTSGAFQKFSGVEQLRFAQRRVGSLRPTPLAVAFCEGFLKYGTAWDVQMRSRRLSTSAKLSKGDVLPHFNLKNQDGEMMSSSKLKNKPVVLYFYHSNENPECTKEACAFRDSYDKFDEAEAKVIGISADSPKSHQEFRRKNRLQFGLLSDEGNKLREAWGIWYGKLPGRQTYVIDKKGVVRLVFKDQHHPEQHVTEALKALETII